MDNKKVVKGGKNYFTCNCGKNYLFQSGLCKHQRKCLFKTESLDKEIDIKNEYLVDLFKLQMNENKEMQKIIIEQNNQIIELSKEKGTHIHNNTINNKFNLNFFLNEQCKDALNITDFVSSLALKLTDLEKVGQLGYVEGISQIIVNGLKKLDINKRPVHCSDLKREILYVKDENQWSKEDTDKTKMKNFIHQITYKNIQNIPNWVEENPTCKDNTSNKNDEYMKLISNCMIGDSTEEQSDNLNKIISKISKEIKIDK